MACHLFGAKPLSEPMMTYCWLDPKENISMKCYWKFNCFDWKICIWKYHLQNGNHCVQASICCMSKWNIRERSVKTNAFVLICLPPSYDYIYYRFISDPFHSKSIEPPITKIHQVQITKWVIMHISNEVHKLTLYLTPLPKSYFQTKNEKISANIVKVIIAQIWIRLQTHPNIPTPPPTTALSATDNNQFSS